MRVIMAVISPTIAFAAPAAAESFAFMSSFEPANEKTVTAGENSVILINNKGKYRQKWASGNLTTGDVECTAWSVESEPGYDLRGICQTTDSDGGTAGYIYNCKYINKSKTEQVCCGMILALTES